MMDRVEYMPHYTRTMRVVVAGVGQVDIERLTNAQGQPVIRVDVISDFDRYGPAPDGLRYVVKNGDPGAGVVFVTGEQPTPTVNPDVAEAHAEGEHAFCLPGCQTGAQP